MLPRYDGFDDGQVYRRMLNLLEPQLRTLSKSTTLIWLAQPPLGNGDYDKFESEIGSVASRWKIEQYNLDARQILG